MKKIPLYWKSGEIRAYALVDDRDFKWLSQWAWCVSSSGYVRRSIHLGMKDGKAQVASMAMHRQINDTPSGMDTDHINGNRLDNRRKNLQSCTRSQNIYNRKKTIGKCKYKGVSWSKRYKLFIAQMKINGKQTYLGRFTTEIKAAEAYRKAAKKLHGTSAKGKFLMGAER